MTFLRMTALAGIAVSMMAVAPAGSAQQEAAHSDLERAPVIPASVRDGTVTFRLNAPTAREVAVVMAGRAGTSRPMTKGTDGVWIATVGPLDPGLYSYAFRLDGARVNQGHVEVPGSPARIWEVQGNPAGFVVSHSYRSTTQNRRRDMLVYLPPNYFAEPNRRFPVLYLFSGMGERDWTDEGRANLVYDNLIARGQALPTIVVMPNNTTGPVPVPALENAAIMGREITGEIVPFIDRTFRTLPDRDHRAIAGLSFGGGTAFTVGARNLDMFAWVAEFGTGAFGGGEHTAYAPGYADYDPEKITPNLYAKMTAPATRPKLFFMSVGTEDPRAPYQEKALAAFRANGVRPVFKTYPGGHEFKVFRNSLIDLAPMLFGSEVQPAGS